MQQLDAQFRDKDIFNNLSFFQQFRAEFSEQGMFFLQFLVSILLLDPDPGSENDADPDPKHYLRV